MSPSEVREKFTASELAVAVREIEDEKSKARIAFMTDFGFVLSAAFGGKETKGRKHPLQEEVEAIAQAHGFQPGQLGRSSKDGYIRSSPHGGVEMRLGPDQVKKYTPAQKQAIMERLRAEGRLKEFGEP